MDKNSAHSESYVAKIDDKQTRKRFIIVFCLFIGIFIAYLDRVNVSVLAANDPFLLEMGITGAPVQIGMMMSVFLAAYGVANVLLAPIGDYLGPRKSMMLCIALWTVSLFLGGIASSFTIIIASRILLGIGEGMYYPLQSVFVKNWFPRQERGRANAAWIVGQSVAPAVAMPFFAYLIGQFGGAQTFTSALRWGLSPCTCCGGTRQTPPGSTKVSAGPSWNLSKQGRKLPPRQRRPRLWVNASRGLSATIAFGCWCSGICACNACTGA